MRKRKFSDGQIVTYRSRECRATAWLPDSATHARLRTNRPAIHHALGRSPPERDADIEPHSGI